MKCLICRSTNFKKVFLFNETSRYDKKTYPLFRCTKCGLIRPNPLPYGETTKNKIYDIANTKINFESPEYEDYLNNFKPFENAFKELRIKGNHLDIGCGHGHLLLISKRLGLKPEGVELNKSLAEELRKKGFVIHNAEIKSLEAKKYDIMFPFTYIDHNNIYNFICNPCNIYKNK